MHKIVTEIFPKLIKPNEQNKKETNTKTCVKSIDKKNERIQKKDKNIL